VEPGPDSLWRRDFARRIAVAYSEDPNVDSVIVSGSTARGHADRYSDIELGVFWSRPPSEDDRRLAAARTGADLHRLFPYEADYGTWADDLFAGRAASNEPKSGVLVEVQHLQVDYVDQVLDSVLLAADPDEEKHNLISGILDGVPLCPSMKLDDWKRRAVVYPDDLAQAVVRRHAQIDHFWRSEMWLARGDNRMMLYDMFNRVEKQLLHMLLGINQVYYFGFKWLDALDARLRVKPRDLVARLREVYQVPAREAAPRLVALVEETYNLVEAHFPEIDMARLRAIFRYRRPDWEKAPEWPSG
jgi:predicted nucleotidyltransferase